MDLGVRKYVKWQGNLAYINSFTHVIQKGLVDIETEVKTGCVECVFTWPPSLHLWTNKHELWQKKLYLIVTWIALIDCHLTNCLAVAVLTHSPLTCRRRVSNPGHSGEMVMWSPSQTGAWRPSKRKHRCQRAWLI